MRRVQVSIDDDTLQQVDGMAERLGLQRSEIARQALRQWLRSRAVEGFERVWIAALDRRPDETSRAEEWLTVQTWSRR